MVRTVVLLVEGLSVEWFVRYTASRGFVSGVVRTVVLLVEGLSVEWFILLYW